ncbi:MAG: SigB/SigF/SigG family RNA polymerase sigma factor [Bacilli bacterium]|nr:SigB/SigF/SigG family RNA polymerase sigma factor [Bacilli bacterium]
MAKYKVELNGYDINKSEKLSHKEMMILIRKYQETNDLQLKERLIMANLKLVLSLIQKYQSRCDNMDDLFQVGIIGLIKAIDHFDTSLDLRFSTYAVPLIIGEVKRFLRDNSPLRIPRSLRDIAYKILIETEDYSKKNQREPTIEELSRKLNIDQSLILEAMHSTHSVSSLSQEVQNDGQGMIELENQIGDKKDDFLELNRRLDLKEAMRHLDEKENLIIRQRYYEGQTQSEIAQELFISQAQVSRIEKQALQRLQKYMQK